MPGVGRLIHRSAFIWSKTAERDRERKLGATKTKVIMPRKIVPYKCCLPDLNISVKKDFDTLCFTNVMYFQVLSVMFIDYHQNVNKHSFS